MSYRVTANNCSLFHRYRCDSWLPLASEFLHQVGQNLETIAWLGETLGHRSQSPDVHDILDGAFILLPLHSHRFSYDLDFNIHREAGHTFRKVQSLREHLNRFAETRRSPIRGLVTLNNQRFHWITFNYRHVVQDAYVLQFQRSRR
jgi:hypothetical protein